MIGWHKCTEEKPKKYSNIVILNFFNNSIDRAIFINRSKNKEYFIVQIKDTHGEDNEWDCYAPDSFWAYASEFNFPEDTSK